VVLLQTKTAQQFEEWTSQLRIHRLYRQHEITYGTKEAPKLVDVTTPVDDYPRAATPITPDSPCKFFFHPLLA
jgi:oxysterol-binding protein-related protein 3/6/7